MALYRDYVIVRLNAAELRHYDQAPHLFLTRHAALAIKHAIERQLPILEDPPAVPPVLDPPADG
jgi:hypothetical protein